MHSYPLGTILLMALGASGCKNSGGSIGGSAGGAGASGGSTAGTGGASSPFTLPMDATVKGDAVGSGTEAAICAISKFSPTALYPEVVLMQDISGSMAGTRWSNTKAALAYMADTLDSRFRLGLYFFPKIEAPKSNSCDLPTFPTGQYFDVMPALGNTTLINDALNLVDSLGGPFGGTPTAEALAVVRNYLSSHDATPTGTPRYIILVTDGSPNCTPPTGDGDATNDPGSQAATLAQIQGLSSDGVGTFVVGYEIDTTLQSVMNQWAKAGGGKDQYIDVINQQTLSNALGSVANTIIPCEFRLDNQPDDPTYVRVQLDGVTLKLDDQNGWTLVDQSVVLHGSACQLLRDGAKHDLQVQRECAPITIY